MFKEKPKGTWTCVNNSIRKENKMKENINHLLYLKSIKEFNTINECIVDKLIPNYKDCLCTKGSEKGDYLIEVDNEFLDAIGKVNSNLAWHEIEYCYTPSTSNFMIKDKNGDKVTYLDPADVMDSFINRYNNRMKNIEKLHDYLNNKGIPLNQISNAEEKTTQVLKPDPILISLSEEQDHVLSVIEQMYQKFIYKKVTPWEKEWRSDKYALVGHYGESVSDNPCSWHLTVYAFDRERIGYLFHVLKHALDVYYRCDQIYWYDPEHYPRLVQIIHDGWITTTSIQDFFNSTLEIVRKGLITHPVDEENKD